MQSTNCEYGSPYLAVCLVTFNIKCNFLNILIFFAPSDSRFSNSCISAKYCPIQTNHTSMESLFIHKSQLSLMTGLVVQGHNWYNCSICYVTVALFLKYIWEIMNDITRLDNESEATEDWVCSGMISFKMPVVVVGRRGGGSQKNLHHCYQYLFYLQ